jgi:hypothetical protein
MLSGVDGYAIDIICITFNSGFNFAYQGVMRNVCAPRKSEFYWVKEDRRVKSSQFIEAKVKCSHKFDKWDPWWVRKIRIYGYYT